MHGATYLLSPEVKLFTDQLQQLGVTERQEVYDFIDPTEKLVPPEMCLRRNQRINYCMTTGSFQANCCSLQKKSKTKFRLVCYLQDWLSHRFFKLSGDLDVVTFLYIL